VGRGGVGGAWWREWAGPIRLTLPALPAYPPYPPYPPHPPYVTYPPYVKTGLTPRGVAEVRPGVGRRLRGTPTQPKY